MGTPLAITTNATGQFIAIKSSGQDVGDLLGSIATIKRGCMYTGCRFPSFGLSDGIQTNGTYATVHQCPLGMNPRELQFLYCNSYATGNQEASNPSTITIKASVDLSLSIGIIPILFRGQRSVTIEPGGYALSDVIDASVTPLFPTTVYTWVSVTSGQKWPVGQPSGAVVEGFQNGSDTTLGGFSGSAVTGGAAPNGMYGPTAIICTPNVATPSFALVGDSIIGATGIGDVNGNGVGFNSAAYSYCRGWAERAIGFVKGGFSNFGIGGEVTSNWTPNNYRRNTLAGLCATWVWYAYGANDLAVNLAGLQANAIAAVTLFRQKGMKVALATILPRTSSSDSWATVVNQTDLWGSQRVLFNQWLRAGNSGADAVIDAAGPVESSLDSGKWKTGGLTADGTHPGATGAALIAASINMSRFT
jgi:lysophospholipase L1-like esterase